MLQDNKIKDILNKLGVKHDEHYTNWMNQPNVMCEQKTPSEFIQSGRGDELLSMLEELHNSETRARNRVRRNYVKKDGDANS